MSGDAGHAFLRAVGRLSRESPLPRHAQRCSYWKTATARVSGKIDAQSGTVVKTLPEDVTENLRPGFATLLAAVTFVLLIACSNVANLLLVRFSGAAADFPSMALGATRASVLRLLFSKACRSVSSLNSRASGVKLVPLLPKLAANFLPIEAGGATAISLPVLGSQLHSHF